MQELQGLTNGGATMTLTCPRCFSTIAIHIPGPLYEVRIACPACNYRIVVEVGLPVGVGPTETKEE